jgi:mannose-6-phosphate isomerase
LPPKIFISLPKVLSVEEAIPLQVHPDKNVVAKLHNKILQYFTHPNRKQELLVALGPFEAFGIFSWGSPFCIC